jgi:secreted trypsin-like serine protease
VTIGDHKWNYDSGVEQLIRVANIISHPKYTSNSNNYDFAILTLTTDVVIGPTANPACLPKDDTNQFVGETATASGWGTLEYGGIQADILTKVELPVISNLLCSNSYPGTITANMVCAGEKGKDACQGDSGGMKYEFDIHLRILKTNNYFRPIDY